MGIQSCTHWDALAHVSYEGKLYNGVPSSVDHRGRRRRAWASTRSRRSSAAACCSTSRSAKGVDRLDGGYAITGDDLDAAAELGKVEVQPGDIVLHPHRADAVLPRRRPRAVRRAARRARRSRRSQWFRDHDVAAVATDNITFEVYPSRA